MNINNMKIGTTKGISGYYAILYHVDEGCIQTGIGRYETKEEAQSEARDWARSNQIYTDFDQTLNLEIAKGGW